MTRMDHSAVRLRRLPAPLAAAALALVLGAGCRESSASATKLDKAEPAAPCGVDGAPECPTQQWMKATLQAYLRNRDFRRLEASFTVLGQRAPDGFEGWARMSEDGARAAKAADEGKVRASCQECHDQHRARFREQLRSLELL
jgi:hypothetical protein